MMSRMLVLLAAALSGVAGLTLGDSAGVCSCDCCEVEVVRADDGGDGARLECVLAEPGLTTAPSGRARPAACGALCRRSPSDQLILAAEASELDAQRFCFFECAPAESGAGGAAPPGPGDPCRALSKDEAERLEEQSAEEGDGNGVAPMTQADVSAHFLARRVPSVVVVDGPSGAAGAEWGRRQRQLSLAAGAAAVAEAPAPAPGPAAAAPWSSVLDPMPEEHAKFLLWAQEAEKMAKKAEETELAVKELSSKAIDSMPVALAAAAEAKAAADKAREEERAIRKIFKEVLKKARAEAAGALRDELPVIRREARERARQEYQKRAAATLRQMLAEAPKAAAEAAKPWQAAMQRAAAASAAWVERGNMLAKEAADLSARAEELQGSAEQWAPAQHVQGEANVAQNTGDAVAAQRLLGEARQAVKRAEELNTAAGEAFDTAREIDSTLPMYTREAAQAAYHAEVLLNPDAPPPGVVVDSPR